MIIADYCLDLLVDLSFTTFLIAYTQSMFNFVQRGSKIDAIQCCAIENDQDPSYVVNWHFSRHPDRC